MKSNQSTIHPDTVSPHRSHATPVILAEAGIQTASLPTA